MRCESCGTVNQEGMKFCGNCGRPLVAPPAVTVESRARTCVSCGRSIGWDANICMYCGYDYRMKKTKPGTEGHMLTGAILTLLAAILGMAILMLMYNTAGFESITSNPTWILSFSCALVGIVGGVAALMQRFFPLAVLGAAAAIFTPAFFFAIPGLVLIANSATKFRDFAETK